MTTILSLLLLFLLLRYSLGVIALHFNSYGWREVVADGQNGRGDGGDQQENASDYHPSHRETAME